MVNYWMELTDPLRVLDEVRRHIDRAMVSQPGGRARAAATRWPRFSLEEQSDGYQLSALVPGLAESELKLTATANTLTITGARGEEPPEGYTTHRKERGAYRFTRTFDLPAKIDPDNVKASLENGVLTITMPRSAEARPRVIKVNAA